MELPFLNNRIKEIIDFKASGNVAKFSKMINISQQKVNRIFNIDTRTGNYPSVPSDILTCITEMFVDIDSRWLLTGEGSMLKEQKKPHDVEYRIEESQTNYHNPPPCEKCRLKDQIIESQRREIETQAQFIQLLQEKCPQHDGQKRKAQ